MATISPGPSPESRSRSFPPGPRTELRTTACAEVQLAAAEATAAELEAMGVPDDIARTTLFPASDLASYMTGTQIVVDGGRLLA